MAITTCGPNCTMEQKNGFKGCGDPLKSYEGAVLYTYERNGYDDSDFYAIVWDAEAEGFKHICYASTRGWTYHNGAKVDATPEVIAAAEAKLAELLTARFIAAATAEASKPTKGKMVRSTTTRGKNKGIEGKVMWYGQDSYRDSRYVTFFKVGIKVEGEAKLRYIDADKAEVISPEPIDVEGLTRMAQQRASQHGWRIDF